MKASLVLSLFLSAVISQNALAAEPVAKNGAAPVVVLTAAESAAKSEQPKTPAANAVDAKASTVITVEPAKTEAKPEAKTAAKTEAKKESKPEAKPVAKSATKKETKPAAKAVTAKKSVAKPQVKAQPKVQAKAPIKTPAKSSAKGGSVLRVATTQLSRGSVAPQKPMISKSVKTTSKAVKADKATEIFNTCALQEQVQKKSALVCLNKEITRAEALLDSAEVRLFNCAQLRKIEKAGDPNMIDALVRARRNQLVEKAEAGLKTDLEAAGSIGPRQTRLIQLRATLNHLGAVEKLDKKICNADAFAKVLSK